MEISGIPPAPFPKKLLHSISRFVKQSILGLGIPFNSEGTTQKCNHSLSKS
jgi:hypothetical protein